MTRVVIVSAGLGSPSTTRLLADQMAAGVRRAEPGASVEVVELRPLAHDVVDATLTGFASPRLQHVIDQVGAADALGFVTPIFQASYSGLFKSFADVLEPDQLIGKPVLLGATGGTARHSLAVEHAMRPLMAYLQAVPVPTGVFASPHDWSAEGEGALTSRVDRAVGELMSLLGGAGTGRTRDDEIDLFSETMLSISDPSRGA
ncbi:MULTISPECIES: CE1759 family FMN reductase [unclassified Aeromicrobium]|jgi:FMN reductase|uniref:CE1759 family FMN reductase n=1 Tax=unclassified Aeromicrobium TaxID=2633570 RepID=UPI0010E11EFC|nr:MULTISPECIES: CE1759 family FMN reductase [unclassified Aeromicrobium]RYY43885.1 MAG: NADPH-dependent FMN reductase [Actinomycetales bacterium]